MLCHNHSLSVNAVEHFVDRYAAPECAGRTAFLSDGRAISYQQYYRGVHAAADQLLKAGVQAEDRVTLLLDDSPEFAFFFFAILKIGAIAVPLNVFARIEQLEFYFSDCKAHFVVAGKTYSDSVQVASGAPDSRVKAVLWVDKDTINTDDEVSVETYSVGPDADAFWLYTSGSSGSPKAVIHRHASMELCARNYGLDVLGANENDIYFSTSKLFFAYGIGNSLLFPLSVGATAVLLPQAARPKVLLEYIERYKPTLFFSVPAIYSALLKEGTETLHRFRDIRMCISAGESLPIKVLEDWEKATGSAIFDGIGSTEALHIFCSNRIDSYKPGTSGKVVSGYQLRIVNEQGIAVTPGEAGNLQVRGETLAKGYWNQYELNRKTFHGEWLSTGDVFVQDEDGYYVCLGRYGDSFKVSGLWVSAIEIEHVILSLDNIEEVAVVSGTNDEGLSVPIACVVLKNMAATLSNTYYVDQIKQALRECLSSYKIPDQIEIVDCLPRTATGKVDRAVLRSVHSGRSGRVAYG